MVAYIRFQQFQRDFRDALSYLISDYFHSFSLLSLSFLSRPSFLFHPFLSLPSLPFPPIPSLPYSLALAFAGLAGFGIGSFSWRDSGFGGIFEWDSEFVISNAIGIWIKSWWDPRFGHKFLNPRSGWGRNHGGIRDFRAPYTPCHSLPSIAFTSIPSPILSSPPLSFPLFPLSFGLNFHRVE